MGALLKKGTFLLPFIFIVGCGSGALQITGVEIRLNSPGLSPAFSPAIVDYHMYQGDLAADVQVTVESTSDIRVNGQPASTGVPIALGNLTAGDRILVQPGNGKTYSILVLPDDFPRMAVTASGGQAPGYFFLSNFNLATISNPAVSKYLVIMSNHGAVLWYYRSTQAMIDFDLEPTGNFSFYDLVDQKYFTIDKDKNVLSSYEVVGHSFTDNHEFQLNEDQSYYIASYVDQTRDLSAHGGASNATVVELALQHISSAGTVLWEWNSEDYYQVTDGIDGLFDISSTPPSKVDYVHFNSFYFDQQGNVIISNRNMSEVSSINIATKNLNFRLGGENNEFTFVNDSLNGFHAQHFARMTSNDRLLLYDNGNMHSPSQSRAVEYQLDLVAKTATLVWQFYYPGNYSSAMGSAQRLNNGNTLIGWGGGSTNHQKTATEVKADGTVVFECSLPAGQFSYRVVKYDYQPWFR